MAEQSLFGVTPEALQASRANALQAQALQYAKLDPFQRANMSIYQGAGQLGGAIGGMLGGQDPEMMRIKQRQQLLQGINPNDAPSLKLGIEQAMAANDYPAAQELATRYQNLLAKQASTEKDVAAAKKEKQLAIPADVLKAQREAALRQGIRTLADDTSPEGLQTKKTFEDELAALTRGKEITPTEIERLQRYRDTLPPGSAARVEVDKVIQAEGRGKGTTVTTLVGQAPKIAESVDAFDKTVAPYRATYDTAATARTLLNEASASNNSQAFEAARTTLAKAIGENKLSNEDIRRTGIDPRLIAGALDWVNKKIEGVPNQDIIRQMYAVSTALQQKAGQQINEKADRAQSVAKASKFEGDLQTFFPKIPVPGAADQDKEARYQAWKKTQQTPKGF